MIRADWGDLRGPVIRKPRGVSQQHLVWRNQDAKRSLAISQLSCGILGRTEVAAVRSHHSRMRISDRRQLTYRIVRWFFIQFSLQTQINDHYIFSDADTGPQCPQHYGWDETNSHRLQKSCGGKGMTRWLSQWKEGRPCPLPGQAFIAFLGTLHWGWSSFTMHRFALGGYLLQKTKEWMLLMTSKKKDICKCKGRSGWTGYTHPWEV